MAKIKICGITNVQDALGAVDAGADALGFMFYAKSPRVVTVEAAKAISAALPPFVTRVGVFVNPTVIEVQQVLADQAVDIIQFHGEETPEFCRSFGARVIKAFRVRDGSVLNDLSVFSHETWLLDSYVPGKEGGTGSQFNWEIAVKAGRLGNRIILAGGLTPGNVGEAIKAVSPYAVDVSSGVESAPGKKDGQKMRDFVAAARGIHGLCGGG